MKRLLPALFCIGAWAQITYDDQIARAREAIRNGDAAAGLAAAQSAIRAESGRWEGYLVAGGALSVQGRRDEAISMWVKALARAPEDKRAAIEKMLEEAQAERSQTAAISPSADKLRSSTPLQSLLEQLNAKVETFDYFTYNNISKKIERHEYRLEYFPIQDDAKCSLHYRFTNTDLTAPSRPPFERSVSVPLKDLKNIAIGLSTDMAAYVAARIGAPAPYTVPEIPEVWIDFTGGGYSDGVDFRARSAANRFAGTLLRAAEECGASVSGITTTAPPSTIPSPVISQPINPVAPSPAQMRTESTRITATHLHAGFRNMFTEGSLTVSSRGVSWSETINPEHSFSDVPCASIAPRRKRDTLELSVYGKTYKFLWDDEAFRTLTSACEQSTK